MSNNTIKDEVVYLLRNGDILSTTVRGVTTRTDTATLSGVSTYVINRTNVKNVRALSVAGVNLKYGSDYTIDVDYLDTTVKCQITFRTAQTGALSITYDYGSDKIFNDYPRDDLTIDSYPRIAVDIVSQSTDAYGLGGKEFITSTLFTAVVYSDNQDFIENRLGLIKSLLISNSTSLYYAPVIRPFGQGPIIKSESRNQTILHRNEDFMAQFRIE